MKTLGSELAFFIRGRARRNLKVLLGYMAFLAVMIIVYALLFRHFMWQFEAREYSFVAGFYWTVTAMTTLGFERGTGFVSDLVETGRLIGDAGLIFPEGDVTALAFGACIREFRSFPHQTLLWASLDFRALMV